MRIGRNLKKTMALLITLVMVLGMVPMVVSAAAQPSVEDFVDVPSDHWAYNYVDFVVSNGYFLGTSETTFSPENLMTRAMFVTVLARYANAEVDNETQTSFLDVPVGEYYSGAVAWGVDNDIINGQSESVFGTNSPITREDMVVLIVRTVKALGQTLSSEHEWIDFIDKSQISPYSLEEMESAVRAGLIFGYPDDNSLRPKHTTTRAEVAAVISRLAGVIEDIDDPTTPLDELPTEIDGPPVPQNPGPGTGPATIKVTYNANLGIGTAPIDNNTYVSGATVTVLANTFTRSGYIFENWNSAADGSGTTYEQGDTFQIGATGITLFAQWVKVWSVSFVDWDGTVIKTEVVKHMENVTPPTNPSRLGYIFTGWNMVFNVITDNLIVTAQYVIDVVAVVAARDDLQDLINRVDNVVWNLGVYTPIVELADANGFVLLYPEEEMIWVHDSNGDRVETMGYGLLHAIAAVTGNELRPRIVDEALTPDMATIEAARDAILGYVQEIIDNVTAARS